MAVTEYDYIIVGSGASGAVIANRLSANAANSVLLLEAGGGDTRKDIQQPDGLVKLWGSEVDWAFSTEPQPEMLGRQITINQGKVLGGSTSINAMIYVRGNSRDFDLWNALGGDGWAYTDVLPYFKKSEDFEEGASEYHGAGGPLQIRVCPDEAMRSEHFLVGATELGYDVTLVKEATADYSDQHMHAALVTNLPNYAGAILTTDEVVEALSSVIPQRQSA